MSSFLDVRDDDSERSTHNDEGNNVQSAFDETAVVAGVDSSPDSSTHLPPGNRMDAFTFRITQQRLCSQLTLSEVSGSLGDLGTFIPLYVALCRQGSLYAGEALFAAGLCHVITGLLWDLPMPVQPMKSIAAVALVEALTLQQVTTAGIWMGVFLTALGVTNAIECVNRIVPMAVVCGLQLGVGISLAIKGFHLVADLTWWGELDCIFLGLLCALVCLYYLREPLQQQQEQQHTRPAVALYLFLLGSLIAVVELISNKVSFSWTFRPSILTWALADTSWKDWRIGLIDGAIPQLPLSTLNSVISVCCLAQSLYPNRQDDPKLSRRLVCISVGLMNLLLCPFGAMPNCHGAGGLAGQYKFGARHGASVIFLGTIKMLLAICLGAAIVPFLEEFPSSILGVLLATAGHELACTGLVVLVQTYHESFRSQCHAQQRVQGSAAPSDFRTNAGIALLVTAVIVGLKKTHYGALAGWVAHMIYGSGLREWRQEWAGRTEREYEQVLQQTPQDGTREVEEPRVRTLPVL